MSKPTETRNFGITALHPVYRREHRPFAGTLVEVKREAQKVLDAKEGDGWKVVASADGETVYCTYRFESGDLSLDASVQRAEGPAKPA
jgi:hypothetical protein